MEKPRLSVQAEDLVEERASVVEKDLAKAVVQEKVPVSAGKAEALAEKVRDSEGEPASVEKVAELDGN